jgi:hypothetical protein
MPKAIKGYLVLSIVAVCILIAASPSSSDILIQTGFEEDDIGEIPQEPPDTWQASGGGFEVDNSRVKEGSKSLGVMGGQGNQGLGALFETQSQVITAEFWLYVDGAERSLTVYIQDPNTGLTNWGAAGPYVNWIGGKVRHYPGAWEEIGVFTSEEWHYVRLVVNTGDSAFDFYAGDTVAEVHSGKPLGEGLGFRSAIAGPAGKVCFGTYDTVTPSYIDNLLIYEGDVLPEGIFAIQPEDGLTITWGKVKE